MELAIKGHTTRGKEVIQLLEMLGGIMRSKILGTEVFCGYYIHSDGHIDYKHYYYFDDAILFTLEEFEKRYPYKVGDKVEVRETGKVLSISNMIWEDELSTVHYGDMEDIVYYTADELKPHKETNMNKKLAIKGHPTRGKEVIQLLEVLGGVNAFGFEGTEVNHYYYIDDNKNQIHHHCLDIDFPNEIAYTLEEFLEKFPYKVGDKVITKDKFIGTITDIRWQGDIVYTVQVSTTAQITYPKEDLQPYKEEGINLQELERKLDEALEKETTESLNKWLDEENMNTNNLCTRCVYAVDNHCGLRGFTNDFNRLYCSAQNADKLPNGFELQPDGYFSWVDSKPTYPKTYKECCDVLKIPNDERYIDIDVPLDYNKLLSAFTKLIICRAAYWKIAAEKNKGNIDYVICNVGGKIINTNIPNSAYNHILTFPTEEIRDAFYDKFKDLINECKELL